MSDDAIVCQSALRLNTDGSPDGEASVSACSLDPNLVACLRSPSWSGDLLKSIFRVTVAEAPSPGMDDLPDVSGRYLLLEDEVKFIPRFPFEKDVKYRASFNLRPLGASLAPEQLVLEFLIPRKQNPPAVTEVTQVFPSCGLLPENLLRFYVCFSSPMQRGRALEEISLLDGDGQSVSDALYRAPVELWDRSMRRLTVLLDPGRLKRWLGPNIRLGLPLRVGQKYTLEIGSRMTDLYGRPLRERFRKNFLVGDAVRTPVSVADWKIVPPATGTVEALVLNFESPLDWALLLQAITIELADGSLIDGRVAVDQWERRWSFTPSSPWTQGIYHIRVRSSLEDVCGNSMTGAFDRPLREDPNLVIETDGPSLIFHLS